MRQKSGSEEVKARKAIVKPERLALTVLFDPIGLIKHGKEIVVKEGTPLKAFVDDDVSLVAIK